MFKRIGNFIAKDLTKAMRDNMVIYGAIFPIVLAIVLNFFIPSVQDMKLKVAVQSNAEQKVIDGLKRYAEVELYDTRELVQRRVERNDDMAGIVKEGKEYVILLEGNEGEQAGEIASTLMDMILSEQPMAKYKHVSLGKTNSAMREISGALLLLSAILIGGYISGFNIVDEKETKAIRALSVSPLKLVEFIIAHLLLCFVIGVILAVLSVLILSGTSVNYWLIVLSIAATTGVGVLLGFIIGGLADNLISAIGVVKFLMLIFIGIPIGSLFTPQNFQWVYYVFPNYWAFQSYMNIFNNNQQAIGFGISTWFAFLSGTGVVILLIPILKKRLTLR